MIKLTKHYCFFVYSCFKEGKQTSILDTTRHLYFAYLTKQHIDFTHLSTMIIVEWNKRTCHRFSTKQLIDKFSFKTERFFSLLASIDVFQNYCIFCISDVTTGKPSYTSWHSETVEGQESELWLIFINNTVQIDASVRIAFGVRCEWFVHYRRPYIICQE